MDLFSDLQTAVQADLNIGTESTLFTPTIVNLALNRAYRKAGGLFRWSETEDAKKTSTFANQEYYDYPINWRPGSIWKLRVDGIDYGNPVAFRDYEYELENNLPSGFETLWSSQWRRFFIYPIPTTNGNNNIEIWGVKIVDQLINPTDTTIFSYSMPECNDAIVTEAVAILRAKGEDIVSSQFKSQAALQILTTAWNKVREDNNKYQKTIPLFNVPNFFPDRRGGRNTNNGSPIGNF